MKVRCIHNTGEELRAYENKQLNKDELGKFGATGHTEYDLSTGKEYIVMGMLMGEGVLDYLIDDGGHISAYPYPLFEVSENNIPSTWFFKSYKSTDENYPYQETVWGYHELVFDNTHYEKLVEGDEEAERIYFKRKIELEKELGDVPRW